MTTDTPRPTPERLADLRQVLIEDARWGMPGLELFAEIDALTAARDQLSRLYDGAAIERQDAESAAISAEDRATAHEAMANELRARSAAALATVREFFTGRTPTSTRPRLGSSPRSSRWNSTRSPTAARTRRTGA